MVHLVYCKALFDIGCEIACGTSESTVTVVIFAVPVEVPFVGSTKVAHIAFDHRHRMVFDVFGVASFDVSYVGAF